MITKEHNVKIIETMTAELAALGLNRGDTVIVHSSFKSLRLAGCTPADVVGTLIAFLGSEGTLVMPTFTFSFSRIWNIEPFDQATTPGAGMGVLTETLRTWPGAVRSGHPTFSVAAIGRFAEKLTQNKETASALGKGSSYHDALTLGGKILLLGVGNNRNSMLHYAEVAAELPYNDIPFREFWGRTALVRKNGKAVEQPLPAEFPACSLAFGNADGYLRERGILREGSIAGASSMVMTAREMVNAVVERLKKQPAWLLCDNIICEPCTLRKRRLQERGYL